MAISKTFAGARIHRPGLYGDSRYTEFLTKYGNILTLLGRLDLKTCAAYKDWIIYSET